MFLFLDPEMDIYILFSDLQNYFNLNTLTISRKQEKYFLQISQDNGFSCFPCEESWF
jgi:hypothetical protein